MHRASGSQLSSRAGTPCASMSRGVTHDSASTGRPSRPGSSLACSQPLPCQIPEPRSTTCGGGGLSMRGSHAAGRVRAAGGSESRARAASSSLGPGPRGVVWVVARQRAGGMSCAAVGTAGEHAESLVLSTILLLPVSLPGAQRSPRHRSRSRSGSALSRSGLPARHRQGWQLGGSRKATSGVVE